MIIKFKFFIIFVKTDISLMVEELGGSSEPNIEEKKMVKDLIIGLFYLLGKTLLERYKSFKQYIKYCIEFKKIVRIHKGDFYLLNKDLKDNILRKKYDIIHGHLICSSGRVTYLKSFKNFPKIVTGNIDFKYCKIDSLEGLSRSIKGSYTFYECSLKSLKHIPKDAKNLYVNNNSLTSLEHCPDNLNELWACYNKLTSLKGIGNVESLKVSDNELTCLEHCPLINRRLSLENNDLKYIFELAKSITYNNRKSHFPVITYIDGELNNEIIKLLSKINNDLTIHQYFDLIIKNIDLSIYGDEIKDRLMHYNIKIDQTVFKSKKGVDKFGL